MVLQTIMPTGSTNGQGVTKTQTSDPRNSDSDSDAKNSLFDRHDSIKPEKINILLLSGCCLMNIAWDEIKFFWGVWMFGVSVFRVWGLSFRDTPRSHSCFSAAEEISIMDRFAFKLQTLKDFYLWIYWNVERQGSKKTPSGRPGQVDFPFGQVTFSPSLPDRQGPRQAVRWQNFW